MNQIEIQHIAKTYGKKQILTDVSFEVSAGKQVAIIGRNGCGKTTLLQILAGVLTPDAGEISYFQKDMRKDKKLFRKYCGYLPQDNPLFPELSVQDNLSLWTGKSGAPDQWLTEMFDLKDICRMPVAKLSGGMKRRVSIACAVALNPPILFMDEPTAALDIEYRKEIRDWMRRYCQRGGTILLITHEEEEILESDQCFVLRDGVLTEQ